MKTSVSVLKFLAWICALHHAAQSVSALQSSDETNSQALCSRACQKTQQSAKEKFPLYECSCSPSCSTFGDCCYDSPHKNITDLHKPDFICISVVGHGRYKAISACPPDKQSEFCRDGLGHMPPVTSRKTNTTYANMFCALCNGDGDSLIKWNVELKCNDDDEIDNTFNDDSETDDFSTTDYIYRSGNFWSLNEADGSKTLCMYHVHFNDSSFMKGLELRSCSHVRKISECAASWKDLSVLKICRSYEDPVYFHNTLYQNMHCAQCNYLNTKFADCVPFYVKVMLQMGLHDSGIESFCQTRGSQDCIQFLSDTRRGRPYDFANLLKIHEKACVPPKGRKCCQGESFDRRTQNCRKTVRI